MKNPIWIVVDGGTTFEGHQAHWADCFFSNATQRSILLNGTGFSPREDELIEIREMTDEEVAKYPHIFSFVQRLIDQYGEA